MRWLSGKGTSMRHAVSVLLAFVLLSPAAVLKEVAPGAGPATGRELFSAYCASCHGIDGKGHGARAGALKTPPPDLTTLAIRNDRNFPFALVSGTISGDLQRLEYVEREMPCFGLIFRGVPAGERQASQRKVAALTEYIRSLQAK